MAKTPAPSLVVDAAAVEAAVSRRRALAGVAGELASRPDDPLVQWVLGARVAQAVGLELGDPAPQVLEQIMASRPRGTAAVPSPGDLHRAAGLGWDAARALASIARDGGKEIMADLRADDAMRAEHRAEAQRRAEAAERGRKIAELLDTAGEHMQAPDARERAIAELTKLAPGEFSEEITKAREAIARVRAQRDEVETSNARRRAEEKQAEIAARRAEHERYVALGERVSL